MRKAVAAMLGVGLAACASSSSGTRGDGQRRSEPATVGVTVPPEKFEEIDHFFRTKVSQLQFDCYNREVERTHKKYQGFVSLLVMVMPGGKAGEVKLVSSTLGAPGIEQCIVEQAKGWVWPDVPAKVPYNGSLSFKPAW